jgi:hypothetical protein
LRTPGTLRDNLFPRASSEFRAVVTKGSRTAETALYSSRGMQEAVQDRHEGSGAQQRDGELQSSTESSREGIADLHRVMLAVRVICRVRGPTTPSGVGPFSRWKATPTHVIAGQTVDPVNPRPSRHDTPSGLPLLHVGTTGLPLLGGAALGQAKRSEEIDGTANQRQAGPGRNQAGRDGDVQDRRWPDPSGRVRPGAARGQAVRRLQVPAPHITKVGDACMVTFPERPAPIRSSARCYAQGRKGVITVGSGGGSGPTTTAASGAGSNVALVTTPKAAVPGRPASRPSTGPAGGCSPSALCSR